MKFTKETFKRTIRTFLQAAIAYIVANVTLVDFNDKSILKSAVIGLITSAIAAGISAIMNLEQPPEQLGGGKGIKWETYIKTYSGKRIDWDGCYGVQCVDLIDHFIEKCLGLTIGYYGNAKTWWQNRNNTWLKNNFTAITPSYKNGELKAGDIGIRTSGTYGHIFIVAEPTANGKIKYYDQNYNGTGAGMTLRTMPYDSNTINGVLRPKDQSNLPQEVKEVAKYGNAYMLSAQNVYCDSLLMTEIGSVSKGEGVYLDGSGSGNDQIVYKCDNYYKTGYVRGGTVKKN